MTKQVIRVEPVNDVMSITWMLGKRCNYDCMYCPTALHDSTSSHLTLEELQQVWKSIVEKSARFGLKYKLSFTGGEATSNKHLVPFLTWLRAQYNDMLFGVLLTTNGSATTSYYKRLFALVDNISFSTHSEFINEKKFFNTVIALKESLPESKFIHVNIMDEFWNKDRISKYTDLLTANNISHSVNVIDYSRGTRAQPILQGKLNLDI